MTKQEQMLSILKSKDYDGISEPRSEEQTIKSSSSEWKLLAPIKQTDLNNILLTLLLQQQAINWLTTII